MRSAEYLYNIQQGTPEWLDSRLGRLTGTDAHLLMKEGRKDPDGLGIGLVDLLSKKCADYIVGDEYPVNPNFWMNRGNELEPEARSSFSALTFQTVDECGFIAFGDHAGHSPDGLISEDGMLEIKCPAAKTLIELHETGEIDPKHYAQMMWGLAITGRKYCIYYVYHPKIEPYVKRIERNDKEIASMLERFDIWENRLKVMIEKYK
jgi:hypothetical protein